MVSLPDFKIKNKLEEGILIFYILPALLASCVLICPHCGEPMVYREVRRRRIYLMDGTRAYMMMPRFKCTECSRVVTVYPDGIIPGKLYTTWSMTPLLLGVDPSSDLAAKLENGADECTVYRWKKQAAQIIQEIYGEDHPSGLSVGSVSVKEILCQDLIALSKRDGNRWITCLYQRAYVKRKNYSYAA